jgi:hypothetical protein
MYHPLIYFRNEILRKETFYKTMIIKFIKNISLVSIYFIHVLLLVNYLFLYYTSDSLRLPMLSILILKCFSTVLRMLFSYKHFS